MTLRRRIHSDERGIALITVIGLTMVMALLLTAVLNYGVGSMRQARVDQDWNAALAAAEAGIDDFLYRINRDNAYWQAADPDWDGGSGTLDPDNDALQPNGFAPVPGEDASGTFHYEIDASAIGTEGNIVITSTGRVRGADRTVRATLRKKGFLDFLYFTDYETMDPTWYPDSGGSNAKGSRKWAANHCERYRYASPPRHQDCADIYWYGDGTRRDIVDGPFHTNDTIAVSGDPEWKDEVTTSDAERIEAWLEDPDDNDPYFDRANGSSNPTFPSDFPQYDAPMVMPPTNDAVKAKADPIIGGEGCLYRGSTFVRLADGGAYVTSAETADPNPAKCRTDGGFMPLPDNGVIYVEALPAGSACPEDVLDGYYDLTDDITQYDHCAGNVFIEGELDGRLTVAAENDIVITNDLTYAGGHGSDSDDMLGLVANNFVEVFHPVRYVKTGEVNNAQWNNPPLGCNLRYQNNGKRYCVYFDEIGIHGGQPFSEPNIDAAILSVRHSFRVQNHQYGYPLDTLHVFGAIGQKFRGPVGTFNNNATATGYEKGYLYDLRLKYLSPPHFLDPVKSAWAITEWSEERTPDGL